MAKPAKDLNPTGRPAAKPAAVHSVAFVSLGCPKNLVDSERMLGLLAADGLAVTSDAAQADAIVINTCGFLEASKEESLREIRDAVAMKKSGKCKRVVVAGCLVQRHKTRLLNDAPGIDRLVGVFDREHIVEAVRGKENPRQDHGHFLGKYHDLSRELVASGQLLVAREDETTDPSLPATSHSPLATARELVASGQLLVAREDETTDPSLPAASHSSLGTARELVASGQLLVASEDERTDPSLPATSNSPLATAKETKTNRLPVFEDDRARLRLTPRHFAYLRISEGCNQGCTFCTIPSIRGLMRSKPIDRILAEARELAADGAVELNLIGQDTTSFGSDIGYAPGLSGLLSALDRELKDVHWLRLMYAYPSCFTDEMIRTIADRERVVKYIDMPLQHINDELLTKMRRRVTRMQIETLLDKLRRWVPGIAIRTTFIAGSPGETDQQHAELVRFVKEFGFDMMGVFPYSQEPGTPMGRMEGQLPDGVKKQRVEELMLAQQEVAFAKAKQMKGQTIELLIERPAGRDAEDARSASSGQGWVARSQGQAPDIDSVTFLHPGPGTTVHPGEFVAAKVTDWQGYDLVAELPKKKSRGLAVLGTK